MEYQLWGTLEQYVRKLAAKKQSVPFGHPSQVKTFKSKKNMIAYLEYLDENTYNKFRRKRIDDQDDIMDITSGIMNIELNT